MARLRAWVVLSAAIIAGCTTVPAPKAKIDPQAVASVLPVSKWAAQPKDGLSFTVTPQGEGSALVRIAGTAMKDNWANIEFSPKLDVAAYFGPDFSVTASLVAGDLKELESVSVQVAAFADETYVSDVVGSGKTTSAAPALFTVSGKIPPTATKLVPYMQIRYKAGAKVDLTLRIEAPTLLNMRPKTP